jgi:hypothetical protein
MTGEEIERAIQLLIEHHAKVSTDIEGLKEAQKKTDAKIRNLADSIGELTTSVSQLVDEAQSDRRVTKGTFHRLFEEMRDGFDKLILGNEVTRDLASQVARLAITTSQRVTILEDKLA